MPQPAFPGRLIKINEPDAAIVKTIAAQLKAKGYAPTSPPGVFDAAFKSLVKLYQAQNVDALGRPLEVDGEVGSMSWGSLFSVPAVAAPAGGPAAAALAVAISQIGVQEQPEGSNRGPKVDEYQRAAGLTLPAGSGAGYFWCMAFVFWCFKEAAAPNAPVFPKTAGCLDAWNKVKAKSPGKVITRAAAMANPALVKPGMVFILDYGGGQGHTGFVRKSVSGALLTVEGNSNSSGSRNGLGVFELNRRKVTDKNLKGFIDFT